VVVLLIVVVLVVLLLAMLPCIAQVLLPLLEAA
jgi:hypothetical protein